MIKAWPIIVLVLRSTMMSSSCFQYILFFALVTTAHAFFMVKLVDGSFAPWSIERRAPDDGFPLRLVNHNDISYLTTVRMGTPFQDVEMAPSLSQNFISVAASPPGVSSSGYYNPSISSSYTPTNDLATIQSISGGTLTGRFAGENCLLNFTNAANFAYHASVCLTNTSVADALYPIGAKGVLGYGINAPPSSPANCSLIPTFLPANFTSAVCGIELNHMDDPVPDGIFTMGALDRSAYTGDFTNVPVPGTSQVSWSIPFESLSFVSGGSRQSLPGLLASIDIYHNVIQLPTETATQIYAGVPGSQSLTNGMWSLPCTASFPITLTFGGKSFSISERDTITKLPNGTCRGAVTGGAQEIAKIGSPFLRTVYTQFGADRNTNGSYSFFVGFAAKNVRTKPATVTTTLLTPTTVIASNGPKSTSSASGRDLQDVMLFSTLAVASVFAYIL